MGWPFQEERLKVKGENPSFSICEIAKELGRRWAEMAPEVKQRYQQVSGTVLLQKLYYMSCLVKVAFRD